MTREKSTSKDSIVDDLAAHFKSLGELLKGLPVTERVRAQQAVIEHFPDVLRLALSSGFALFGGFAAGS